MRRWTFLYKADYLLYWITNRIRTEPMMIVFNTFLAGFVLSPFMFGLATGPPQDKLRLCDKRDLKVKTILWSIFWLKRGSKNCGVKTGDWFNRFNPLGDNMDVKVQRIWVSRCLVWRLVSISWRCGGLDCRNVQMHLPTTWREKVQKALGVKRKYLFNRSWMQKV